MNLLLSIQNKYRKGFIVCVLNLSRLYYKDILLLSLHSHCSDCSEQKNIKITKINKKKCKTNTTPSPPPKDGQELKTALEEVIKLEVWCCSNKTTKILEYDNIKYAKVLFIF